MSVWFRPCQCLMRGVSRTPIRLLDNKLECASLVVRACTSSVQMARGDCATSNGEVTLSNPYLAQLQALLLDIQGHPIRALFPAGCVPKAFLCTRDTRCARYDARSQDHV
jgi:hypothetical protein